MVLSHWLPSFLVSGLLVSCAGTPEAVPGDHAIACFQYDASLLPDVLGGSEEAALQDLERRFVTAGFEVLEVSVVGPPAHRAEVRVAVPLGQHIRSPRDVAGLAIWAPPQGLSEEEILRLEQELGREMDRRRQSGEVVSPLTDVGSWIELPESARAVCTWLPLDPVEARHRQEGGQDRSGMEPRFVLVEVPKDKSRWMTGPTFRRLALTADSRGRAAVEFALVEEAREDFRALTASLIGRPLYVAVDGRVISAPKVQSPIPGMGIVEGGGDGLGLEYSTSMLSALPGRRAPASTALVAVEWETPER